MRASIVLTMPKSSCDSGVPAKSEHQIFQVPGVSVAWISELVPGAR